MYKSGYSSFIHPDLDNGQNSYKLHRELVSCKNRELISLAIDVITMCKRKSTFVSIGSVMHMPHSHSSDFYTVRLVDNRTGFPFIDISFSSPIDTNTELNTFKVSSPFHINLKERNNKGLKTTIQSTKPSYILRSLEKALTRLTDTKVDLNFFRQTLFSFDRYVDDNYPITSKTVEIDVDSYYHLIKSFIDGSSLGVPNSVLDDINQSKSTIFGLYEEIHKAESVWQEMFSGKKLMMWEVVNVGIVAQLVKIDINDKVAEKFGKYNAPVEALSRPFIARTFEEHFDNPLYGDSLKCSAAFIAAANANQESRHYKVYEDLSSFETFHSENHGAINSRFWVKVYDADSVELGA